MAIRKNKLKVILLLFITFLFFYFQVSLIILLCCYLLIYNLCLYWWSFWIKAKTNNSRRMSGLNLQRTWIQKMENMMTKHMYQPTLQDISKFATNLITTWCCNILPSGEEKNNFVISVTMKWMTYALTNSWRDWYLYTCFIQAHVVPMYPYDGAAVESAVHWMISDITYLLLSVHL